MKRAILSVWNKDNIVKLANFLILNDFEILSTGGTKNILEKNNISVTSVSDITEMEEIMNGRVKTLHPKIFAGILADQENSEHMNDLSKINVTPVDLIVVNLYPFNEMSKDNTHSMSTLIEYIDIGGPSMLRAAAKNYKSTIALCKPEMYEKFMDEYKIFNGSIPIDIRREFASIVFEETYKYDQIVYNRFIKKDIGNHIINIHDNCNEKMDLRYGENPDQEATFYFNKENITWKQISGKELSYNNFFDIESAISIVEEFEEKCCAIIKHSNPCGFAIGNNFLQCFEKAVSSDPVSYFGGIIGFNGSIDLELSQKLVIPFLECIVCRSVDKEALDILMKKKNLRIITYSEDLKVSYNQVRSVLGGFLHQTKNLDNIDMKNWKVVTKRKPTKSQQKAMEIGWKLVKYIKSNAISISNQDQLLGVGAGQMSRIDSVKIAIKKLKENGFNPKNTVLSSDAFFPFSDGIEFASKHEIGIIIQPGGSIKDDEVIKKADELDLIMVFTGQRLFLH